MRYLTPWQCSGGGCIDYEPLDRNCTTALKGFSVLTVVFCHMGKQLGVGSIQFIAGAGVSIFLILSGYGLTVSYKKNGLKGFWKKKLINIVIPFYAISIACSYLSGTLDTEMLIRILTFRSMWYMWYLLIWYVIFYVIMTLKDRVKLEDRRVIALYIFAAAIWYVVDCLFFTAAGAEALHSRQMPAFCIGVALVLSNSCRHRIESTKIWEIVGLGIVGLLFMGITQLSAIKGMPYLIGNLFSLPTVIPLAICVMKTSFKWKRLWSNSFLLCSGIFSYEIYLTQGYLQRVVGDHNELCLLVVASIFGLAVMENKIIAYIRNIKHNNGVLNRLK